MDNERKNLPSASGIERISLCPGSWNLERTLPEPPQTEDAASGTRVHAFLAGDESVRLSDDELDVVIKCNTLTWDALYNRMPGDSKILKEQRIWLKDGCGVEMFSGKFDRAYIAGKRGAVIDFKTGRNGVTEAKGNRQLRSLAVLVAQEFGLEEVIVAIIQPWGDPQTSACFYGREELEVALSELVLLLAYAANPDIERIPGEKQCQYCRAKAICPEARQAAFAITTTQTDALTPAVISAVLDKCKQAEDVITACREKAKEMLAADPNAIPGWKLKPGRFIETITEPQEVFNRAYNRGVSQEQFLSCITVKKTALENAVKAATNASGKALDAELDAILDGCSETKQAAPSLEKI